MKNIKTNAYISAIYKEDPQAPYVRLDVYIGDNKVTEHSLKRLTELRDFLDRVISENSSIGVRKCEMTEIKLTDDVVDVIHELQYSWYAGFFAEVLGGILHGIIRNNMGDEKERLWYAEQILSLQEILNTFEIREGGEQ